MGKDEMLTAYDWHYEVDFSLGLTGNQSRNSNCLVKALISSFP